MELPKEGKHCLGILSQDTPAVLLTLCRLQVVSWFGIHQPSDAHKFVQVMKLKRTVTCGGIRAALFFLGYHFLQCRWRCFCFFFPALSNTSKLVVLFSKIPQFLTLLLQFIF